ncbi:MAG: PHP domain-containing protein [Actinobacteria bacterium]|nr:PHP domain-containing protein [Actinomycetota bacterium]
MDPVAALNEIAYWLERELASPFKTKAFRHAAAVIAALPAAEVAERGATGRWTGVAGVGGSTAEVIREAVAGGIPDRLAALRAQATTTSSPLRAKLRGDLHSHSDWSDGTTSIASMAETAVWLGHEYLALTDHSPRLRVANGLSPERLRDQLREVAEHDVLLSGIEVDILDDGALDQVPELLDRLDVVVASVHSKLKMDKADMTARMLAAVTNPHTRVLGHITGRLVEGSRGTRPGASFDAEAVFAACAAHDVAVELNSRPERQDPPDALIALALEAGCLFAIDSDAHAPGQLGLIDLGAERAEGNGIPAERIVTTWPRARLLDWAKG